MHMYLTAEFQLHEGKQIEVKGNTAKSIFGEFKIPFQYPTE